MGAQTTLVASLSLLQVFVECREEHKATDALRSGMLG